ncbi:pentatricopeptide repeat-containing protein At5g08305 [Solanum tuberosum]|uniref:Pentatricopeptide repeat-containing protein n=1 Tax=Solanum tuberosum TaxID=4113 RepID=M1D618_SOLTU|nr:PREDICTED: pentatricopeptide repeat-containing protein At5g08305 [Solanum tuberosum]XP_015169864.1 PREDICTED: pentatricopeptide repeat-containing protein At5g08305 [Solanum tuberosum]
MLNVTVSSNPATLTQKFITFLEKCKSISEFKKLHALLITCGISKETQFSSRILCFTALSDSSNIDYAHRVFLQIKNPTIFDYNALIRGYSNSKNPCKSLSLFVEMLQNEVFPNYFTYPFVVKCLAKLCEVRIGRSVHGGVLKNGFDVDLYVSNSLIHMYGSCGDVLCARKVFDEMPVKNLVSWNSMLDGYGKCGDVVLMREVFDSMIERDVVSWSSLIDGYVKDGEYAEALAMFEKMRVEGPKANEVTMVSVLGACAHLGALEQGRVMHEYVVENKLPMTLVLRTSLVDMYAKCGAVEEALVVFREALGRKTDVLIWNAMIGGLATHGLVTESLELYKEMCILKVRPDEITYLCLLCACAHGGLVKEAWCFFDSLGKDGTTAKCEHYACMMDVLARAGRLTEAYRFLCEMPMEPTASMLGALLSGCINHGRLDLAEIVGKKLIDLEPFHDGRYVGLSNVYALKKRWDEAKAMREAMDTRGVKKLPGFSVVEIFGALHRFIAHDKAHPESDQIYTILDFVLWQMKLGRDCEEQEQLLCDINVGIGNGDDSSALQMNDFSL